MGMIGAKTVVAVFDSRPAAEGAKATLLRAGVPESRIALSAGLTDDGMKRFSIRTAAAVGDAPGDEEGACLPSQYQD